MSRVPRCSGAVLRLELVAGLLSVAALGGCQGPPNLIGAGGESGSPGAPVPPTSRELPGSFDRTFGAEQAGVARVRFGSDDGGAFSALEVSGERIVAAGTGYSGLGGSGFVVTRLLANGVLDPAFAGGTLVKSLFVGSTSSYARAFAVGHQAASGPLLIGWHEAPSVRGDIALERFYMDGAEDAAFGTGGKVQLDLGGTERIHAGSVLPDGRILAAGERNGQLLVARTTEDGALDTSFAAPRGFVGTDFGAPASARALAIDAKQRIVVVGQAGNEGARDLIVLRLLSDGRTDASFAGGRVVLGAPESDETAAGVLVLADGRIVISADSNASGNWDFRVVRLEEDGALDGSFGVQGVASSSITGGDDRAEDAASLPDGTLLVIGNAFGGASPGPVLARYTLDGALDSGFGAEGVLSLDLGDNAKIESVRAYPNHRVVIGGGDEGETPGPGTYGLVARLWM